MSIQYLKDEDRQPVIDFIRKNDPFFLTPISRKTDPGDYTDKIIKHGIALGTFSGDRCLSGLILFYANDLSGCTAYISYLAVAEDFRGKGIAGKLMEDCLVRSAKNGMKQVKVETWSSNEGALALYQSHGFEVSRRYEDEYGVKKIELLKYL